MKKYLWLAPVMLLAAACKPETDNTASLSATPTEIEFAATGGAAQTIAVTAKNVAWDYSVPESTGAWITAEKRDGGLSVMAADNMSKDGRTGQIRIFAENNDKVPAISITLRQAGNADAPDLYLTVEPASLTFEGEGAAPQEVKVTPSVETLAWSAAAEDDAAAWITVEEGNGTFAVSVQDNPEESRRTGRIIVTPSEPSAKAKAVIVVQEGKIVPPSLTVTPTDPLAWEYDDLNQAYLTVTAVNCTWTAKAVDEEGKATDWILLTPDKNNTQLNVRPATRNTTASSRSGYIIISVDAEGVDEVCIAASQTAAPDHFSTFNNDIDLNTLGFSWARSNLNPRYPDDLFLYPWSSWEINILSDGVNFNPNTGKFDGTGHKLSFNIITDRKELNDEMNYVIPDGDYIVGPAKPAPEDPDDLATSDPFTILQGSKTSSFWAPYQGFWYLTLTDGATDGDMAPIITGTVTITKQADGNTLYRFDFDLTDDMNNRITGTYEGSIGLYVNGVQIPE